MRFRCIPELFAALLVIGCSIKEDRGHCPCILDVDLSLFSALTGEGQLSLDGEHALRFDWSTEGESLTTSKGSHRICVAGGSGYRISTETARIEQYGEGELFTFHEFVQCEGEREHIVAIPRKEFTSVILNIDEEESGSGLVVCSDYNGLQLTDSSPLKGQLEFIPEKIAPGTYRFRLPRQGVDNSLTIQYSSEGAAAVALPLNKWVADAGFDWEAPDLADINIGAEHSFSNISLTITPWQTGMTVTISL